MSSDALTPYLAVRDAAAAIRWYRDVLDAVPDGEPYLMDDGRIGHAELLVQGARLMLADESPERGYHAPHPGDRFFTSLNLQVPDTDAQFRRAADAGATVEREPVDNPYGRVAVVIDPFGHRWMFHGPNTG